MPPGAQRFALQQLERTAGTVTDLPLATITAVTVGGGTDGQSLVTVNYLGSVLGLPHMDHYTPVVGHRVALARIGGVWTIFGRPVGFPPA